MDSSCRAASWCQQGIGLPEGQGEEESCMEHTTIAVDLAKSVFQIAISRRPGQVDEEHRLARDRFLPFFAQQPPATIVLEACGSAHH